MVLLDEISQLVLICNLTDDARAPITGEQHSHKIASVGVVFDNEKLDVFCHNYFLLTVGWIVG